MSQFTDEDPLRTLFADYENDTAPQIRAAGVTAAATVLQHRRKVRSTLIVAGAALMFALPVAAYALVSRPTGPPVTPGSPGPTVSAQPTPSATPASPVSTEEVPPGGISRDDLHNATFEVPAFASSFAEQCASGLLVFTDGRGGPHREIAVNGLSYADIDADGRWETIVQLLCTGGETGPQQLLALRRDGAAIDTIGTIVRTASDVKQFFDFTGMSDGTVKVSVRSGALCCDTQYSSVQHQVRTYGWTGQRFQQVLGSPAFHSEETDLKVTVSKLVFSPASSGIRTGRVTVTVSNGATNAVEDVIVLLRLTGIDPGGFWTTERWLPPLPSMHLGPVAAGRSVDFEVAFLTEKANVSEVGVGVIAFAANADGDRLADSNPQDNEGSGQLAGVEPEIEFS